MCDKTVSNLNPTRQKLHLLKSKVCKFLSSKEAQESLEHEVVKACAEMLKPAAERSQQVLIDSNAVGQKAGKGVDHLTKTELMALQQSLQTGCTFVVLPSGLWATRCELHC